MGRVVRTHAGAWLHHLELNTEGFAFQYVLIPRTFLRVFLD